MNELLDMVQTPDFSGDFAPGCGPIDKPGIYNIPIEKYHAGPCVQPSLSSTGMPRVRNNPKKFWWDSSLNPEQPKKDATHYRIGRLAHTLLLEPEKLGLQFHVSSYADLRTKDAKAERDLVEASGRTWLKDSDVEKVSEMIAASSKDVVDFFDGCVTETSLVWQDAATGVWLRVRPDGLPLVPAGAYIADYKTAESADPDDFQRIFHKYGYHVSAWLYQEGVRQVLGADPAGFAFFVQEKSPPYDSSFMEIDGDDVARGGIVARQAIDTFAACLETGIWPGYQELHGFRKVYLPKWKRDEIDSGATAISEEPTDIETVIE